MISVDRGPLPAATPHEGVPALREAPEPGAGRRHRRLLLSAVAGAVVVAVLVALFNGPVADVWYQSRQRHLAHDLGVARPRARRGQAVAVLQIPVVGINQVVGEGDGPPDLRAGPGHRIGTPMPGEPGNSLIFGHRGGWGGPFAGLAKLHRGDQITIQPRLGRPTLFTVTSVADIPEEDTRALRPSNDHRVTLVTGAGGILSTRRLVVTAVSGDSGDLQPLSHPLRSTAARSALLFNPTTALLVLLVLVALAAARRLRGRYRPVTMAAVLTPLAVAAFLALLVDLDQLLPALR